jgi:hypothetical protein
MIQDYRNQGIPSQTMQGNERLSINSAGELNKVVNQQKVQTNSKNYFNEPCVTDYFYRNQASR